jgi:TPR repeat protein
MTDVFSSTRRGLWMLPRILAENDFLESIDDADDLWRIGVDYFCGTDRNWNTTVALNLFRRAAAKNHSDAMWMVHKVEANGGAFPVDVQTNKSGTFPRKRDGIVAWLAGDMDDPRALHLLGCYGERYPWDRDEEALKKAAEKGYALSMGGDNAPLVMW